ncbi:SpaH/EbpB family LPXTG-anchored major pilin, partial [Actinomyces bouchesdurhonensis]|uniref:SpaH/EbpB family LPXTG-anchored major pilin n=1 Tax=Actinomyces bouchesdurhonensis TaxID=1852361 RepID=UPI00093A0412
SPTQAAPTFGLAATQERAPSLVDLDATRTGSLTIHKLIKNATNGTDPGNGLEDTTASGTPLDGAEFTVSRLTNVDLTTQAGWEKLLSYNGDVAAAKNGGTDAPQVKTTSGGGLAEFDGLTLGAYVVEETVTPPGYVGSKPFIVTVPMTHPTDLNKWVYDVHAYPKNTKAGLEKTVNDTDTPAVGSPISYTIKSDVPGVETLDYYDVVDQYDKRVQLPEANVALKLINGKTGDVTLTKDVDYKLIAADAPDGKTKFWTAEFTQAGRKKLIDNRKDDTTKVQMDLSGTVNEPVGTDGIYKNTGYLLPSAPSNGWTPGSGTVPPPGTPKSEVESKFGKVKITKTSSKAKPDGSFDKLSGAKFAVYKCTPQSTPTANFDSVDATLDQQLTVNGATEFTTGTDGTVTIDGLRNNDWENNEDVTNPGWYCLVETKAPDGYELQTRPIAFQILQSNSKADNTYTLATTVKDVPKNGGFNLPVTGAAGIGVLIGAGTLLVGGAGAIALANKRRKDQADS